MGFQPIARTVPQYVGVDGKPYSGAVLKAYKAGTTTVINIAGDAQGTALDNGIALNASGFPEISGNVVIPHVDEAYKLSLYPSQAAADSDTGAVWTIDNLSIGLSLGESVVKINSNTVLSQATHANAHIEITGTTTLALPAIATVANSMVFTYRNAGTTSITFDANSTEKINGQETVTIEAGGSGTFIAGDDGWYATGVDNLLASNLELATGDTCESYRASKVGWVLASGQTIGSDASNATSRANADTVNLYSLLWESQDNTLLAIEDASGVASIRGASALDDFAAGKRLPLPDERGRTSVGRDDMGGTAAGRLTLSRPEGINGTILGGVGGEQQHTQTVNELALHEHFVATAGSVPTTAPNLGSSTYLVAESDNDGNEDFSYNLKGTNTSANIGRTSGVGGGEAMNNVQPSIVKNVFIKL